MIILDGKTFASEYRLKLADKVKLLKEKYGVTPGLAVVLVGDDPASQIYVRNKIKACDDIGIKSFTVRLDESVSQEEVENAVKELAENPEVDGLFVQLPMPKKFNAEKILKYISKIITVKPHSSLSLQSHNYRQEHWVVIKGNPVVTLENIKKEYTFGQSIDIPVKTKHRLENLTDDFVEILEIQMGDVLDEDDIIRFEDAYNRV